MIGSCWGDRENWSGLFRLIEKIDRNFSTDREKLIRSFDWSRKLIGKSASNVSRIIKLLSVVFPRFLKKRKSSNFFPLFSLRFSKQRKSSNFFPLFFPRFLNKRKSSNFFPLFLLRFFTSFLEIFSPKSSRQTCFRFFWEGFTFT